MAEAAAAIRRLDAADADFDEALGRLIAFDTAQDEAIDTSVASIVAVPYASAAIACAPPTAKARVTPARLAAASTSGLRTPCGVGTTMMISPTPATCAGSAFMSTVDGYAALPPGT